jgi:PST family polysaccharide transporter
MLATADGPALDPRIERGLRWSLVRQVVTLLISTVGVLAYTRLLQPEDLGAVALAWLVYSGLLLLVQAPIRDAVVYYQEREAAYGSAAFWLLLAFSAIGLVLVLLLAGTLGQFYQSAEAAALTRAIAVAFFFDALAVVPGALLLKHFRFAVHESLQTVCVLILLLGWVGLAAAGWGAWSLVLPQIVAAIFWAVATWLAARFRPLLRPGRDAYAGIVRFSRNLLGSNLATYLKLNMDQAAVGTLGEGLLGWYSFGESQSAFAVLAVGMPVAQVALPAMAEVKTRRDLLKARLAEVRRIYAEMLRLAATLSTPWQIGAFVLADLGISVLFGEQWLGAVPVFRAYLTFRLVQALLAITDSTISALGRPQIRFAVDLAQLPFFVAGLWFGLRVWGGIEGVAWSLAIVRTVVGLVYLALSLRLTRLAAGALLRALLPSSLAAVFMGLLVYGLRHTAMVRAWSTAGHPLAVLVCLVLVGVISYFLLLYGLDRRGFREVRDMAWRIMVPGSVRRRLAKMFVPGADSSQRDEGGGDGIEG